MSAASFDSQVTFLDVAGMAAPSRSGTPTATRSTNESNSIMQLRMAARLNRPRRWLGWLLFALYLVALGEGGARLYWKLAEGVPFLHPDHLWYRFYPESRAAGADALSPSASPPQRRVLLLGGSVLHPSFGSIAERLETELAAALGLEVEVVNLANVGRTSRDSLFKYAKLGSTKFDLVIVYHGINDVRMNNCPRAMFRQDYTHCSWYDWIERFQRHPEAAYFILPYTLEYVYVDVLAGLPFGGYIPRGDPKHASWIAEGYDIKTVASFTQNLSDIVTLAQERGSAVMLMTFAAYFDPNYTRERFQARSLDYNRHLTPTEIWGEPRAVAAAVEAHNQAIRKLAAERSVIFVDQANLMPRGYATFDDCCHLTPLGCQQFVTHTMAGLQAAGLLPQTPMKLSRKPPPPRR